MRLVTAAAGVNSDALTTFSQLPIKKTNYDTELLHTNGGEVLEPRASHRVSSQAGKSHLAEAQRLASHVRAGGHRTELDWRLQNIFRC